ncbi:LPP20 family lipoprotein [Planktomarina temperata]|nr:LPP20 family lipoprotein [Planktomarina temperata]
MRHHSTQKLSRPYVRTIVAGLCALSLSGCSDLMSGFNLTGKTQAEITSQEQAKELKVVRTALKSDTPKKAASPLSSNLPVPVVAASATVPTISAIGYSSIGSQPGKTLNQRRLMAIRAARMDAMRMLTEQVHGLTVQGDTQVSENVVQSDVFRASLAGLIAGARTVKIEPKGSDTYAVTLEIDRGTIRQLLRANRSW